MVGWISGENRTDWSMGGRERWFFIEKSFLFYKGFIVEISSEEDPAGRQIFVHGLEENPLLFGMEEQHAVFSSNGKKDE